GDRAKEGTTGAGSRRSHKLEAHRKPGFGAKPVPRQQPRHRGYIPSCLPMAPTPSVDAPLGDFTADRRVVRLAIMAALIGAFGSLFAQAFHLSPAERKTLLVSGAAGGMAAVFGTPVAAALLAIELLLFEWKPRSFIPVACAAAVAGAVRVPLLGSGPLFPVTPHALLAWPELFAALGLGIVA